MVSTFAEIDLNTIIKPKIRKESKSVLMIQIMDLLQMHS